MRSLEWLDDDAPLAVRLRDRNARQLARLLSP